MLWWRRSGDQSIVLVSSTFISGSVGIADELVLETSAVRRAGAGPVSRTTVVTSGVTS